MQVLEGKDQLGLVEGIFRQRRRARQGICEHVPLILADDAETEGIFTETAGGSAYTQGLWGRAQPVGPKPAATRTSETAIGRSLAGITPSHRPLLRPPLNPRARGPQGR